MPRASKFSRYGELHFYVLSPIALTAAWIAFYIGWIWQRKAGGFSNLDAGSWVFVVVMLMLGAVLFFKACIFVFRGFFRMSWAARMIALFYLYRLDVWLIHHSVEPTVGLTRAWFFCLLGSIILRIVGRIFSSIKKAKTYWIIEDGHSKVADVTLFVICGDVADDFIEILRRRFPVWARLGSSYAQHKYYLGAVEAVRKVMTERLSRWVPHLRAFRPRRWR